MKCWVRHCRRGLYIAGKMVVCGIEMVNNAAAATDAGESEKLKDVGWPAALLAPSIDRQPPYPLASVPSAV